MQTVVLIFLCVFAVWVSYHLYLLSTDLRDLRRAIETGFADDEDWPGRRDP